jgi:hypothetical protein
MILSSDAVLSELLRASLKINDLVVWKFWHRGHHKVLSTIWIYLLVTSLCQKVNCIFIFRLCVAGSGNV